MARVRFRVLQKVCGRYAKRRFHLRDSRRHVGSVLGVVSDYAVKNCTLECCAGDVRAPEVGVCQGRAEVCFRMNGQVADRLTYAKRRFHLRGNRKPRCPGH